MQNYFSCRKSQPPPPEVRSGYSSSKGGESKVLIINTFPSFSRRGVTPIGRDGVVDSSFFYSPTGDGFINHNNKEGVILTPSSYFVFTLITVPEI